MERPRTTANIDYDRFSEVWEMVDGGQGWLFHSFHPFIRFLMTKYELSTRLRFTMIRSQSKSVLIGVVDLSKWESSINTTHLGLIKSPGLSVSPTRPSIFTLFWCVTSGFQFQESQLLDFYLRGFQV